MKTPMILAGVAFLLTLGLTACEQPTPTMQATGKPAAEQQGTPQAGVQTANLAVQMPDAKQVASPGKPAAEQVTETVPMTSEEITVAGVFDAPFKMTRVGNTITYTDQGHSFTGQIDPATGKAPIDYVWHDGVRTWPYTWATVGFTVGPDGTCTAYWDGDPAGNKRPDEHFVDKNCKVVSSG